MTTENLLTRLLQADICCHECGKRYGKYSVGCSSMWEAECPVCGKVGICTETRDYGYLQKGINELKAREPIMTDEELDAKRPAEPFSNLTKDFTPERRERIKQQSKILAEHLATADPIMNDDELEDCLTASYEQGEITLKLTEEEVAFLNECLDTMENHPSISGNGIDEYMVEDVALFESIERKITDLFKDHCVHHSLSPALKDYIFKCGAAAGPEDGAKWEIFRDAYNLALETVNRTA